MRWALCAAFAWTCVVEADAPALSDPAIPSGERSVYRLTKQNGAVSTSTHEVRVERRNNTPVYAIQTNNGRMSLTKSNLTPIVVEALSDAGEVTLRLAYSSDRVNYVYPGPRRNKVEKVDANRYDVRSIVYVARALPATRKERVELTLVTDEHVVDVYFDRTGAEQATVPAGAFDCVVYEAGLTGLKGRVYKKKIRFWIEKARPYRLIRQEDEGISDVRLVELVSSAVPRGGSTP